LPDSIVFSKSFLSFSKIKEETKKYMRNKDQNFSKVLFILEKKENEGYTIFPFIGKIFIKNNFMIDKD